MSAIVASINDEVKALKSRWVMTETEIDPADFSVFTAGLDMALKHKTPADTAGVLWHYLFNLIEYQLLKLLRSNDQIP